MGALLQEKAVRLCQKLEEPPCLPRPLLGPLGPPAGPVWPQSGREAPAPHPAPAREEQFLLVIGQRRRGPIGREERRGE